jgi:RNase P subunit RPR2
MSEVPMISLREWNVKMFGGRTDEPKAFCTCPCCNAILVETGPNIIYYSSPPQIDVKCLNCGYAARKFISAKARGVGTT